MPRVKERPAPRGRESRIDINFVCDRFGVKALTIYRWYKTGTFPNPHYIVNKRMWFYGEILDWEATNTNYDNPPEPGAGNCRTVADFKPAKPVESTDPHLAKVGNNDFETH